MARNEIVTFEQVIPRGVVEVKATSKQDPKDLRYEVEVGPLLNHKVAYSEK